MECKAKGRFLLLKEKKERKKALTEALSYEAYYSEDTNFFYINL